MKKFFIILLSILLAIVICIAGAYFYLLSQTRPLSHDVNAEEVRFEIPYGTSPYKIAENLKSQNLIKNEKLFYYCVRYPQIMSILYGKEDIPTSTDLKSGTYRLKNNMNYGEIISTLTSGQQEFAVVSIPEGLTITKIANLLEEYEVCTKAEFIEICHNPEFVLEQGIITEIIPGAEYSVEGYLFPDTYYLNKFMNPKKVAELFIDNFRLKTKSIPAFEGKSLAEIRNTVILASIVEREYRIDSEAPLIASVFQNRLKRTIGLYSCATVEYIITEIEGRPHPGRILIADTRIDNPYNTYLYAGLTPGPISNPGMVALSAAAAPAKTNYYFFQIVDPAAGKHVFTSTFDEHISSHNLYTKN
ncbi:MAG: endolytic transglycosylase MltG [Treponema sp.]|nr:endolytic transglycosylase MltG [Treponema sp.]